MVADDLFVRWAHSLHFALPGELWPWHSSCRSSSRSPFRLISLPPWSRLPCSLLAVGGRLRLQLHSFPSLPLSLSIPVSISLCPSLTLSLHLSLALPPSPPPSLALSTYLSPSPALPPCLPASLPPCLPASLSPSLPLRPLGLGACADPLTVRTTIGVAFCLWGRLSTKSSSVLVPPGPPW